MRENNMKRKSNYYQSTLMIIYTFDIYNTIYNNIYNNILIFRLILI